MNSGDAKSPGELDETSRSPSPETGTSEEGQEIVSPADYVPPSVQGEQKQVEEVSAAWEQLRSEARRSLFFFVKGVLGYDQFSVGVHLPVCKSLEKIRDGYRDLKNGKITPKEFNGYLKVTFPRSWYKSTLCSIAFPIWFAIQDIEEGNLGSNVRIAIAQNTITNAIKKLKEIAGHFESNQVLRWLFPELLPGPQEQWKSETLCLKRTKQHAEGTFEAVGVKTATVSRHYDVIIEDDTVAPDYDELGEENVAPTKDDIGLAIMWHKLTTSLFVDVATAINIVVGTRWFDKDLLSWIDEHEPYFIKHTRAVRESNGLPDHGGEPTWPERFGQDVLDKIQRRYGPYMYSCLYMNLPVSSSTQAFRNEYIQYYDSPPEHLIITTTVDHGGDPGESKGEVDYAVVLTTGKHIYTGEIFVLEISRERANTNWTINKIFEHYQRWKPLKVGIEATGLQKNFNYWIREMMRQRNQWFALVPITRTRQSKHQHILGLQPVFAAGKIMILRHQQALVSELLAFPYGATDDIIDALAMQKQFWILTQDEPRGSRNGPGSEHDDLERFFQDVEKRCRETKRSQRTCTNPVFDVLHTSPVDWSGERYPFSHDENAEVIPLVSNDSQPW